MKEWPHVHALQVVWKGRVCRGGYWVYHCLAHASDANDSCVYAPGYLAGRLPRPPPCMSPFRPRDSKLARSSTPHILDMALVQPIHLHISRGINLMLRLSSPARRYLSLVARLISLPCGLRRSRWPFARRPRTLAEESPHCLVTHTPRRRTRSSIDCRPASPISATRPIIVPPNHLNVLTASQRDRLFPVLLTTLPMYCRQLRSLSIAGLNLRWSEIALATTRPRIKRMLALTRRTPSLNPNGRDIVRNPIRTTASY